VYSSALDAYSKVLKRALRRGRWRVEEEAAGGDCGEEYAVE
jgi:hypothetical protein